MLFIKGHYFLLIAISFVLFVSCSKVENKEYDAVVYGATPAGIIAAYFAASQGLKVLLLEQTGHIGGMSTSGLTTAESAHLITQSITGSARDFYIRLGHEFSEEYFQTFGLGRKQNFKRGDPAFFFESHIAEKKFHEMLAEYDIDIKYHLFVTDIKKEDDVISNIQLNDTLEIAGKVFIDCSYEGDLMARAGISYTFRRESLDKYNESLAGIRVIDDTLKAKTVDDKGNLLPYFSKADEIVPGTGDNRVTTYNFRPIMTRKESNKRAITKPENYDSTRYDLLADYLSNHPETNIWTLIGIYSWGNDKAEFNNNQKSVISLGLFGGNADYPDATYDRRKEIYDDHKDYTLGFLYFLGHDPRVPRKLRDQMLEWGFAKDEFVENDNFPYYLYIREGRRMVSDFVHTQHDIFDSIEKEDAVTLGSHWVDCHHVQRIAVSDSTFTNEGRIWKKVHKPFELSYRIITPKKADCQNLLVPVCVSASHVGFSAIRLEPTWMQLGHVSGTAAALAIKYSIPIQDVPILQLQEKLKEEGMVIKSKNVNFKKK